MPLAPCMYSLTDKQQTGLNMPLKESAYMMQDRPGLLFRYHDVDIARDNPPILISVVALSPSHSFLWIGSCEI